MLKFYKYRRSFSSHISDWQYIELEPNMVEETFNEMSNDYSWSEHFHGIEYFKVKTPPKGWFKEEIQKHAMVIKRSKELISRYKEFLSRK